MSESKPLTILVLEDVPEMGELIRTTLEGLGTAQKKPEVRVTWVKTVLEASRVILKHRPDGVLLDEIVPHENPLELLREPALKGVPVILITASPVAGRPVPPGALARIPKWGWREVNSARDRVLKLRFGPQGV